MFKHLYKKQPVTEIIKSEFSCEREGLMICGTEYRPAGDSLPAAIVSHGFMANQDTVRHYACHLAELGYAAYCFDFNGGSAVGSKSEGKTTEMSVLTEVKDLEAVISYTAQLSYIDNTRTILMGCSQGGFVSALVAAKWKNQIEKLVLFYPALCIPDDARAGKMMFARFDPHNVPETFRCGPMKLGKRYATDMLDINPYEAIAPYPGPVLIIHGAKDSIVHPDYARRAYEMYKNRPDENASAQLCMIEGGGHGFSKAHDAIAIKAVDAFL